MFIHKINALGSSTSTNVELICILLYLLWWYLLLDHVYNIVCKIVNWRVSVGNRVVLSKAVEVGVNSHHLNMHE